MSFTIFRAVARTSSAVVEAAARPFIPRSSRNMTIDCSITMPPAVPRVGFAESVGFCLKELIGTAKATKAETMQVTHVTCAKPADQVAPAALPQCNLFVEEALFGDERAIAGLVEFLKDESRAVRAEAVRGLTAVAHAGPRQSAFTSLNVMQAEDKGLRWRSAEFSFALEALKHRCRE